MLTQIALLALAIPGLPTDEFPFPTGQVALTSAVITVPVGIFLLIMARVFLKGKYLGLVAGFAEKDIADTKALGRFVGRLLIALGIYQFVFPVTVRFWGAAAFVVFIFIVAAFGIALLIGSSWYEKG